MPEQQQCYPAGQLASSPPVTATTSTAVVGVTTGCCLTQAQFVTTTAVTWSSSSSGMPSKSTVSSLLHARDTKRQTKRGLDVKGASGAKSQAPSGTDVYDFKDDDEDDVCEKPPLPRRFDRKLPTVGAPNRMPEDSVAKTVLGTEAGDLQKHDEPVCGSATSASTTVSSAVNTSAMRSMDSDKCQWTSNWVGSDAVLRQTEPPKVVSLTPDAAATFVQQTPVAGSLFHRQEGQFLPQAWTGISSVDYNTAAGVGSTVASTSFPANIPPTCQVPAYPPQTQSIYSSASVDSAMDTFIAQLEKGSSTSSTSTTAFPQAPHLATTSLPNTQQGASFDGVAMPTGGVALPTGGVTMPTGGVAMPTGGVAMPTGGVAMPTGGVAMPTGGVAMPTGGVAMPTGGVAVPTGRVAMPTGGGWPAEGMGSENSVVVDGCKLDMSREDHRRVSEALTFQESELLTRLKMNNVEEVPRCNCGARKFAHSFILYGTFRGGFSDCTQQTRNHL